MTFNQWYTDNNGEPAVAQLLRCLKQMGVKAVRWAILGDGWNYDLPKPKLVAGSKTFDPPQLKEVEDLQKHFLKLLETFRQAKLQIMPVLLDHQFFLPA